MALQKFLSNFTARVEILERNSRAAMKREDLDAGTLESLDIRILSINEVVENLEIQLHDLARREEDDWRKIQNLQILDREMHRTMAGFEVNQKLMKQLYESLAQQLQEDAQRNAQEAMKYQEECRGLKDELQKQASLIEQLQETIKEHESSKEITKNVQITRIPAKANLTQAAATNDEIAIIEPSGSESKRSTRRPDQPSPPPTSVTNKQRLRKKKPLTPDDESIVDIRQTEGYNLRTRKLRQ